jgi:hypothetical protein
MGPEDKSTSLLRTREYFYSFWYTYDGYSRGSAGGLGAGDVKVARLGHYIPIGYMRKEEQDKVYHW